MRKEDKHHSNRIPKDPFGNMLYRVDKIPALKPVLVSPRNRFQVTRSAGELFEGRTLQPLFSPRGPRSGNRLIIRDTLKTPKFTMIPKQREEKKQMKYTNGSPELTFGHSKS